MPVPGFTFIETPENNSFGFAHEQLFEGRAVSVLADFFVFKPSHVFGFVPLAFEPTLDFLLLPIALFWLVVETRI